jgi:hypothetical protein
LKTDPLNFFGVGRKMLWAYQQGYVNANPKRFIITSMANAPLEVEVKDFPWNYLDSYHITIDRDKSKGLFFVLSGRALNNTFSRQINKYSFGEFQMFHKKPPIGDTYRVIDKNTGSIMNGAGNTNSNNPQRWLDPLDAVSTADVYASRDDWTGYRPTNASQNVATMYPAATVHTSSASPGWGSGEVYSTLRDKAGDLFAGAGGSTGTTNRAFTVRTQVFSNMTQSVVYLPFPIDFTQYPENLASTDQMNKNWLPCRGWEYPFHTVIILYT